VYTAAINGVPAMWMKESMRALGLDPDNLPRPTGHKYEHLPPHIKPWKNLWSAGQGVALIDDVPGVAQLVSRLRDEYRAACALPSWPQQSQEKRRD
jgi:nitronate monooxygenase